MVDQETLHTSVAYAPFHFSLISYLLLVLIHILLEGLALGGRRDLSRLVQLIILRVDCILEGKVNLYIHHDV